MAKELELPATIFFWVLAIEVSFVPTMKNHHTNGKKSTKPWETSLNKVLVSLLVGGALNFFEKIVIQLIAISFHQRAYEDRIELNKFQIRCLTKMYKYSREKIDMEDSEFEEDQPSGPDTRPSTPMQYVLHRAVYFWTLILTLICSSDILKKARKRSGKPLAKWATLGPRWLQTLLVMKSAIVVHGPKRSS